MMKIALVTRTFMVDSSYLEESLARVLCSEGYEVCVFTSRFKPASFKTVKPKKEDEFYIKLNDKKFQVKRLKYWLRLKSNVFPTGLRKSIQKFAPDKIIMIGVSDFFAAAIIKESLAKKVDIYVLIGSNSDMKNWQTSQSLGQRIKTYLVQLRLKRSLYRKAVSVAKKIVLYTPETKQILTTICGKKYEPLIASKMVQTSLGYDHSEYYYNPELCTAARADFNLGSEPCLLHLSRIDKTKGMDKLITAVDSLHRKGHNVSLILAGFDEKQLLQYSELTERCLNPNKFHLLPLQNKKQSLRLFHAADLGIYLKVGASIQQAMGCGLPLLLKPGKNVEQLIETGKTGFYTSLSAGADGESLEADILKAIRELKNFDRQQIAERANHYFSYQNLVKTYFDLP